MKYLLVALFIFIFGLFPSVAAEKEVVINTNDSITVTSQIADDDEESITSNKKATGYPLLLDTGNDRDSLIAIAAIIMVFGLPAFIVGIILWFRNKNRQAKYKLTSEDIAAGQPISEDLIKERKYYENNIKNKGIKNICLGIGLIVFLKLLTNDNGLAAIGFIIFCIGLGQIIIYYTQNRNKRKDIKDDRCDDEINSNDDALNK